jgi:hypothetical protein
MFRNYITVKDLTVNAAKKIPKQKERHIVELLIFEGYPRFVSFPYGLLTFDKSFDRLGRPFGRTIDSHLAKQQRKLPDGVDGIVIGIIE